VQGVSRKKLIFNCSFQPRILPSLALLAATEVENRILTLSES